MRERRTQRLSDSGNQRMLGGPVAQETGRGSYTETLGTGSSLRVMVVLMPE